jgi:hypothetical protein
LDRAQAHSPSGAGLTAEARQTLAIWLAIAASLAFSLVLQQERLLTVWRTGGFFDTDDALRMVQVRDLLAGQHWYDMTVWRLDPPLGSIIHWSRLVDMPLVVLLKFFSLFLPAEAAERAARIAFPTLTFTVLLAGGAWAAKIFANREARILGVFTILFCGVMFWQFPPGRIDHHGPQITLLFFAVAALARALDPAQARWAALSGACMAVSLGIGLENLPFFALIAAVPGVAFLFCGAEARALLQNFAAGLAAVLCAVYLLTIGPSRWLVSACDALSPVWLVAALAGAAAYGVLSFCGRFNFAGRLFALACLGGASVAPMALFWPYCPQNPFGALDPVVKSLWLDHVAENLTLAQDFAIVPGAALLMAIPVIIGFCGALFGAAWQNGVSRARWLVLAAVIAAGFAAACLSLRVISSTMPLAALGLLAPVEYLRRRFVEKNATTAMVAGFAVLASISSFGVALALPEFDAPAGAENSPDMAWRRPNVCLDSASYEPLGQLPPGLAVAPIPAGSYLLAHTNLSVLAAPYHRNNHGNRAALDILRSRPALAETFVRKAGAKYVLLCWANAADLASYQAMGPDGLAAQISQGRIPGWLRPIKLEGTIFHAYEVMPPNT